LAVFCTTSEELPIYKTIVMAFPSRPPIICENGNCRFEKLHYFSYLSPGGRVCLTEMYGHKSRGKFFSPVVQSAINLFARLCCHAPLERFGKRHGSQPESLDGNHYINSTRVKPVCLRISFHRQEAFHIARPWAR
jgi:hypothetical protein